MSRDAAETMKREDVIIEFRGVDFAVDIASHDGAAARAKIIDNLNLEVRRGERLVLLGRSGCGKTTTLRLINRLLVPSAGEVLVAGESTIARDAINLRRGIGYVIQDGGLFPHFTVARNIAIVPRLENWTNERTSARVYEMLELVGLEPEKFADRFPAELSGGQRQRVGVARALAADPSVLLLDEPFGALDPLTRATLLREFKSLCERLEKTIVFVTHDLREALVIGTRIGLMDAGKLIVHGTPREFMESSHELARSYRATLEVEDDDG